MATPAASIAVHGRTGNGAPFGALAAGGLAAALGLTVIVGWYLRSPTLVQVLPSLAPMQYNTALGFLSCGLGLASLGLGHRSAATAFGAAGGLLGFVTLLQYLVGGDFGIDRLLMEPFTTVKTSHPGRMAPNTALAFAISGAAVTIAGRMDARSPKATLLGILGAVVLALGVLALVGYAVGLRAAYGWGGLTRMAVHTAAGFVLLGCGILVVGLRDQAGAPADRSRWISISLGVCVVALVLGLWQALNIRQQYQIHEIVKAQALKIAFAADDFLDFRVLALERMANRWQVRGGIPRREWEHQAEAYLNDYPDIQAIEWMAATFQVRWVMPVAAGAAARYQGEAFQRQRHFIAEHAKESEKAVVSQVFDVADGVKGFLVAVPLHNGRAFDGVLIGVLHVKEFVDQMIEDLVLQGYAAALFEEGREIYRRNVKNAAHSREWGQEAIIASDDVIWHLRVWPSDRLLESLQSPLPDIVLGAGTMLGALLLLTLQLGQRTKEHAKALERSNRDLEAEIAERKKIEAERAELLDSLAAKTRQLEAANQELEAFSYSVSHDLRAPLRSMDGFSQALLEDYGDKFDDDGRDYLNRVRAGSKKMGQLIDDLLGLSRVTRRDLKQAPVDLSSVARSVADELKLADPGRDVDFRIAPDLRADGDRDLLRIALQNLLGNAWKFTAKKPRARIEFDVAEDNGTRAFFVRDDGAGFDMAYADKLFQPFTRLHGEKDFNGTGIGLATVQRIIHRHGGDIWAEGAVGKGATVYFTL